MTLGVYALADSPIAATPLDDSRRDTLTAVDQASTRFDWARLVSDALAAADHPTADVFVGKLVLDSLSLVDQATATVILLAAADDVLTIVEARPAFFLWFATVVDTLQVKDQPDESLVVGSYRDDTDQGPLWGLDTTPGQP